MRSGFSILSDESKKVESSEVWLSNTVHKNKVVEKIFPYNVNHCETLTKGSFYFDNRGKLLCI